MKYFIISMIFWVNTSALFAFANFEINFIQNQGQIRNDLGYVEEDILFYSLHSDVTYFIKQNEFSVVVTDRNPFVLTSSKTSLKNDYSFRYDIEFVNFNKESNNIPSGQSGIDYNFYLEDLIIEKCNSFKKLHFIDYYDNIDLIYYFKSGNLKYDFIVRPGADLNQIAFKINGVYSYKITDIGDLIIETPVGNFTKPKPIVYQYDQFGQIKYIDAEYYINHGIISFTLLEGYNENYDLIIDPEVGIVSFCGGAQNDALISIKQDSNSDYYISGESSSSNFPTTPGAYQPTKSSAIDCVVMKFDPQMKPVWITYLGGNGNDRFLDLNINDENIWLVGETTSSNFPMKGNSYQRTYGGGTGDVLIARMSKDGQLIYTTYFGSNRYDSSPQACVDKFGNLWLTGRTNSRNLYTTSDAEQKSYTAEYSAFILKFNSNGNLLYSSFVPGSLNVYGEGIAADNNNNIYITGYTDSYLLPNSDMGFLSSSAGNYDSFLAKFDNFGKNIWTTFFGGANNDYCSNVKVDEFGDIYLFGHTNSSNLPIFGNAFQKSILGVFDSFIAKFDGDCNLIWSSYFGGSGFEGFEDSILYQIAGIDVRDGKLAVAAATTSPNLKVTPDAYQPTYFGDGDTYIAIFDTKFGTLNYCSYFGGRGSERPYDIIINNSGTIVNVGKTSSDDLKISSNAFQKQLGGQTDGYIFTPTMDFCQLAINYPTFHNVNRLFLNGDAMYIDDYIRLTNNVANESSSIWYTDKIRVDKGFETTFSFSITDGEDPPNFRDNPFPGADGLAFVIQNHSILTKGSFGGSMGYQGIPNSIAVEFDMFYNTEKYINDPDGNHVAVFSNGRNANLADHQSTSLFGQTVNVMPFRTDGSVIFSKIVYDANSDKLSIYLAENPLKLNEPILEIDNLNLADLLQYDDKSRVWVGFTSATGRSFQKHNLLSWQLCSYDDVILSIEESDISHANNFWSLYPNPVEDYLNLVNNSFDNDYYGVEVFDLLGKSIISRVLNYSENYEVISINISSLKQGVYYCKILGINNTYVIPFVKQ